MKIYIAGPMTGYPEWNYPAFDAARDRLRLQGFEPVSPADISRALDAEAGVATGGLSHREYMAADLAALATCDAIHLLDGWRESPGAMEEVAVAVRAGLGVLSRDGTFSILPCDARRERLGMDRMGRIGVEV